MEPKKKNKQTPPVPLSQDTINEIINQWKSLKQNSTPTLAAKFNLAESRINCIINKHLSNKTLP